MEDDDHPVKGCLGSVLAFAVGALVLALALGLLFETLVRPMASAWDARGWTPTTCEVRSSQVVEVPDDDGVMWSSEIEYAYAVDGVPHTARRVSFDPTVATNLRWGWQAQVDRLPVGARPECWVDPSDPDRAVLDRSLWSAFEPLSVLPLLLLAGFGGLFLLVAVGSTVEWAFVALAPEPEPGVLTQSRSGLVPLLGLVLCAMGLVVALALFVLANAQNLAELWCGLTVPVALLPLGAMVYGGGRRLVAPKLALRVSPARTRPGERTELQWRFDARGGWVTTLRLELVALGPNGPLLELPVCDADGDAVRSGSAGIDLPADAPPTGTRDGTEARWVVRSSVWVRAGAMFTEDHPLHVG